MPSPADFLGDLTQIVSRYLSEDATSREMLSLLRWQIGEGHALDQRTTLPGHLTTSAFIVAPDHSQILLIDHITIGRWLQPGGHYEPAEHFYQSAAREAVEETGVTGLTLHPWHLGQDRPFVIDSHDVPGKPSRNEPPHIHHDLQYLFVADPSAPLVHQAEEVHAAKWTPIAALDEISPKGAARLKTLR
ncbi:NUDIX hydrolase [Devosia epidermidihirudinis]|uniref:NUDIX hydrolase n=1 Tax=Devosia epidermidihirudinis TaxID=1293439 RepID=UPI0006973590|nr:NUDIX domain-containing protein [Devosia epidermidihirudinis]